MQTVKLSNGVEMPMEGFGVFQVSAFAIANVIAALLFAAGHLPATFLTFQTVDAIVIIRCIQCHTPNQM